MVTSDEIRRKLDAKRRGETISEGQNVPGATVNCPECQTPNLPQAKFCVGCGKPLPIEETPTVPPVQRTAEPGISSPAATQSAETADFKVCPSCNQKNKLNAKFCIICGHKFEENGEGETIASEPEIKDETTIPPAREVLETPSEQVTPEETVPPEVSQEEMPPQEVSSEAVPQEVTPEEVTPEPSLESSDESPVETKETPVVPEIKVPEHLKSDAQKTVPKSEPEIQEIPKTPEEPAQDVDPVEKIKKAKELLDIGAITQEDFDNIKNKYLKQI